MLRSKQIVALLAAGLLAGPMVAKSAMVTELYRVTLPSAQGVYSAGHVFDITVTYDNAGTVMRRWGDGPNGIAQFGSGDDTPQVVYNLSSYPDFLLFSDAQISISGLAVPVSSTPRDNSLVNNSWAYRQQLTGFTQDVFGVLADNLDFGIFLNHPGDSQLFFLNQYFNDAGGNPVTQAFSLSGNGFITKMSVPEPVPLPAAAWLLLSGLAGLGFVGRRRKAA